MTRPPFPVRQVRVRKAQPMWEGEAGSTHVGDLVIIAEDTIKDDEGREVQRQDAVAIVDALWDTLPGGTLDQILIEFMQRRASLFRVGYLSVQELADIEGVRASRLLSACTHPGCDGNRDAV